MSRHLPPTATLTLLAALACNPIPGPTITGLVGGLVDFVPNPARDGVIPVAPRGWAARTARG